MQARIRGFGVTAESMEIEEDVDLATIEISLGRFFLMSIYFSIAAGI